MIFLVSKWSKLMLQVVSYIALNAVSLTVQKHSPSVPGSLGALLSPCFNAFGDLSDCLGGGFKDCLFSPRKLEKIPILTSIFFNWVVQPPTSCCLEAVKSKAEWVDGIRTEMGLRSFLLAPKCPLERGLATRFLGCSSMVEGSSMVFFGPGSSE